MYERCFDLCLAQEEAEIRKEFQRFDLDKNGYITKGRNYNLLWRGNGNIVISAANRLIGEVVQSRRRPLLGPTPG